MNDKRLKTTHLYTTYRKLLGADELHCVPLDGVQSGVGSVARVGRGGGGQRHVRLTTLGDLDTSDCHQLHQLKVKMSITVVT